MQQYTKQQLEGSVRYTQCLVGNWSEDSELKKTILKDFTSRKETGTLIMDRSNPDHCGLVYNDQRALR